MEGKPRVDGPHDRALELVDWLAGTGRGRARRAPVDRPRSPRPGDRIGSYELVAPLGSGGEAAVFVARDLRGARSNRIAWKTAGPFCGLAARLRLANEADIGRGLASRCSADAMRRLCRVVDSDTEAEVPFVASRLAPGRTLQERLGEPNWRRPDIARVVLAAVALVLDELHRHGVVHRDVKPANLQIGDDGAPALLDFGLATAPWGTGARWPLVPPGQVRGTMPYLAPECLAGAVGDGRVDVYALGVVLGRWLEAGRSSRRGRSQWRLWDVFRWATRRDPERRCPTAMAFAEAVLDR